MAKTRMQSSTAQQTEAPATESSRPSRQGRGNQAAADRLLGAGQGETAPTSMGDVGSSNAFMAAASTAMDAALPTLGSFAKLSVSGNIPLLTNGVASLTFAPSLDMQIAREHTGEVSAMIGTKVSIKAEAGREGWGWLPDFKAYVQGYLKGSIKVQGDSAEEIMQIFMLSVRQTLEAACDATGAPKDIRETIGTAVMSEEARLDTLHGMDKYDRAMASVAVGAEAGASVGSFDGSVGAELSHTTMLTNRDGDRDNAEVNSFGRGSVTVSGKFSMSKLPVKVSPKVTFVMGMDGSLVEWYVALGAEGTLTAGEFAPVVLMGAEWATEFGVAMGNMIRNAARDGARSEAGLTSDIVAGLSFGPEAVKYTVFGDQLKNWAASPAFADESSQKVTFGVNGQAGWSKWKGVNCKGAVSSVRSFSLGGGDGPLKIEASQGDNIAYLYNSQR